MNKIILIGNLGRDPEMSYTPNGVAVTKFSLAVTRFEKSASGESQKKTDWYNIVAWRQLAERCSQYLHKGNKVYIEGRLTPRPYTDKNGVERLSLDVVATETEFLTPREAPSGSSSGFVGGQVDDNELGDLEDHPF